MEFGVKRFKILDLKFKIVASRSDPMHRGGLSLPQVRGSGQGRIIIRPCFFITTDEVVKRLVKTESGLQGRMAIRPCGVKQMDTGFRRHDDFVEFLTFYGSIYNGVVNPSRWMPLL